MIHRIRVTAAPVPGRVPTTITPSSGCASPGIARGRKACPCIPSRTLRAYLEGIAECQPAELAGSLRAVLDPARSDGALASLPLAEDFKAELRFPATKHRFGDNAQHRQQDQRDSLRGGRGHRRAAGPRQTKESFLPELREQIEEELEIEVDQYSPPLEADAAGEFYRVIREVNSRRDPGVPVVPSLTTRGDRRQSHLPAVAREAGVRVHAIPPSAGLEEMQLIQGHDERPRVENQLFATWVIRDIVVVYAA